MSRDKRHFDPYFVLISNSLPTGRGIAVSATDQNSTSIQNLTDREYDELVHLHQQLTQEIQHYEKYSAQIVGAVLLLITAIMTVAFSSLTATNANLKFAGILFTTAAFAAGAGMFLSFDREAAIMMNASYLRNIVEPNLSRLKWERDVQRFREKSGGGPHKATLLQLFVFMGLLLVNTLLAVWQIWLESGALTGLVVLAILAAFAFWSIRRAGVLYRKYMINHEATFDTLWLEIRQEFYDTSEN